MPYRNDRQSFGSWKSVREQQADREQQARDRRGENAAAYLADEASD